LGEAAGVDADEEAAEGGDVEDGAGHEAGAGAPGAESVFEGVEVAFGGTGAWSFAATGHGMDAPFVVVRPHPLPSPRTWRGERVRTGRLPTIFALLIEQVYYRVEERARGQWRVLPPENPIR
jgi:hypothetical protein